MPGTSNSRKFYVVNFACSTVLSLYRHYCESGNKDFMYRQNERKQEPSLKQLIPKTEVVLLLILYYNIKV